MMIRPVEPSDAAEWGSMRRDLWPGDDEGHDAEIAAFFAGTLVEPQAVLVAEEASKLVGVAELSIRRDVPGLIGQRVGYVEGLYVLPAFRNSGLGRRLLAAAKAWARQNDCQGFASDRSDRIIIDRSFRPQPS
jgi:aminoglycoside 6'-N-acetyltransferase I